MHAKSRFESGIARFLFEDSGQGTVEFAVVTAAFMVMVIAGGVAWNAFGGGILVDHALLSASHHISSGIGVMADVFSY